MSLRAQMTDHLPRAGPRRFQELAVDRPHDGKGLGAFSPRAAVERRPDDADQGAVAGDRQVWVIRFDHLASRPHAQRPEARRKNPVPPPVARSWHGAGRSHPRGRPRRLPPCPRTPWPCPRPPASSRRGSGADGRHASAASCATVCSHEAPRGRPSPWDEMNAKQTNPQNAASSSRSSGSSLLRAEPSLGSCPRRGDHLTPPAPPQAGPPPCAGPSRGQSACPRPPPGSRAPRGWRCGPPSR